MERQRLEREVESTRRAAVAARRRDGLVGALDQIHQAAEAICGVSGGLLELRPRIRNSFAIETPHGVLLQFVVQTANYRSERDWDLRVAVCRGGTLDFPGIRPDVDQRLVLDVSPVGEFGWREQRNHDARFLTNTALADWAVKLLLEQVERERKSGR